MFEAKILADSICGGRRLTTMEWTFPRCILAEVNTHRMLSRNAASSRAIPTHKMIQRVIDNPFVPDFCENKKGMQAGEAIGDPDSAVKLWLNQRDRAADVAAMMADMNIHKQYINRLLEPWMWCTIIVSATEWDNVWKLRCHPDAEPSFQKIANLARDAMYNSLPNTLDVGEWHLPLVDQVPVQDREDCGDLVDVDYPQVALVSAGRCARVSYLTHDGRRDLTEDVMLANRLTASGHWSPFEHQATPEAGWHGNFQGWKQFRKFFPTESGVPDRIIHGDRNP
jgi:hypothetical protein